MKAGQERAANSPLSRGILTGPYYNIPTDSKAFNGPIGEIVDKVIDKTEATESGLLAHLLVMVGHVVGRTTFLQLGDIQFFPNLYLTLVGPSGDGAKGTSKKVAEAIIKSALPEGASMNIISGIQSGEAIVQEIMDPKEVISKDKGKETVGTLDKRLLIIEEELHNLLANLSRPTDKTSAYLRNAWEGTDLENTSIANRMKATAPHVSCLGHIVIEELRKLLLNKGNSVNLDNGFCNRFLWFWTETNKLIAFPSSLSDMKFFADRLNISMDLIPTAFNSKSMSNQLFMSETAKRWWAENLYEVSGRDLPVRALSARSRPQILRVALIYALWDSSQTIEVSHLESAKAVIDYSNLCATQFFCNGLSPDAIKLVESLRGQEKLYRVDVSHEVFSRNRNSQQLDALEDELSRWISKGADDNGKYVKLEKDPLSGLKL